MKITKEILTERLILRQWEKSDFRPFQKMNSDPEVMEFFPHILSKKESNELALRIQSRINENGWGLWAAEEKVSHEFIGFIGLNIPKAELPFNPCVEAGWRIAKNYWGKGYATEGAKKVLEYAFNVLSFNEVISFTAIGNKRSRAVMHRIGMVNSNNNFNHPNIPPNSSLAEHVLYIATREQWNKWYTAQTT